MRLAWSQLAKAELAEIRRFSLERWGGEVTTRYLEGLRGAVKAAAADPEMLRMLRGPYRVRRVQSHYVIFHLNPAARRLTVARILHVRMDIERHLPPPKDREG